MANLYFAEDAAAADFSIGALVTVSGDEARHAVRVSRLRVGETIAVGDGEGCIATGTVEETTKDRFSVRVVSVVRDSPPAPRVMLVQALAKGDRDERAVEQATEFGVDAIVPWESARAVSRWIGAGNGGDDKALKGQAKWQRIAREAAKQSMRSRIPEVFHPVRLAGLCELSARDDTTVLVLHPRGEHSLSEWTRDHFNTAPDQVDASTTATVALVVGPEGGLSDDELETLSLAGAQVLQLGSAVLRTSSAGPAALAVLNVSLRRW